MLKTNKVSREKVAKQRVCEKSSAAERKQHVSSENKEVGRRLVLFLFVVKTKKAPGELTEAGAAVR